MALYFLLNIYCKERSMDIETSETEVRQKLIKLTLSTTVEPRESNTIIAAPMLFETDPSHIKQYNKMYLHRLSVLRKRIPIMKVYKVQQVQAKLGVISIVGIFKRIQNKRVRAFEKNYDEYYGKATKIYSQNDTLELEDDSGKIKFVLAPGATMNGRLVRSTDLPYGVVIGLTGKNNDEKMEFIVQKITLPSLPQQKPFNKQTNSIRKTLIMSAPNLQQLQQTLMQLIDFGEVPQYFQIKSVIVAGFSHKFSAAQYRQLDRILQKYCQKIDIHIMPNESSGEIYPQKPLHPILFSNSWGNISLANNPQMFYVNDGNVEGEVDEVNFDNMNGPILVCSGQNVKDLIKNCSYGNSILDSIQSLLQYSHLAPTSPFSLKCEMMQQDYLIINQLPHVFIVAGFTETSHNQWTTQGKHVKLISIKQGDCILLDIDNYKMTSLEIQQSLASLKIE